MRQSACTFVCLLACAFCSCALDEPSCAEAAHNFTASGCGLVGSDGEEMTPQEITEAFCLQLECPACQDEIDNLIQCWNDLQPGECLNCSTPLGIFSTCVTANDC